MPVETPSSLGALILRRSCLCVSAPLPDLHLLEYVPRSSWCVQCCRVMLEGLFACLFHIFQLTFSWFRPDSDTFCDQAFKTAEKCARRSCAPLCFTERIMIFKRNNYYYGQTVLLSSDWGTVLQGDRALNLVWNASDGFSIFFAELPQRFCPGMSPFKMDIAPVSFLQHLNKIHFTLISGFICTFHSSKDTGTSWANSYAGL